MSQPQMTQMSLQSMTVTGNDEEHTLDFSSRTLPSQDSLQESTPKQFKRPQCPRWQRSLRLDELFFCNDGLQVTTTPPPVKKIRCADDPVSFVEPKRQQVLRRLNAFEGSP